MDDAHRALRIVEYSTRMHYNARRALRAVECSTRMHYNARRALRIVELRPHPPAPVCFLGDMLLQFLTLYEGLCCVIRGITILDPLRGSDVSGIPLFYNSLPSTRVTKYAYSGDLQFLTLYEGPMSQVYHCSTILYPLRG
jgi:hypothetical protein